MRSHLIRRNWVYRCYMLSKALFSYYKHGKPGKHMSYIGVTGTDGKSTTSMCTYHILKNAGYKVWLLSTVFLDIWSWLIDNQTHLTSLSHNQFWAYVSLAEQAWYTHMVVEVSSHALYQYRTRPLQFDAVGITNLTREHLDFHWTMKHYAQTKAELFARLKSWGSAFLPDVLPYTQLYQKHRSSWQEWKIFRSIAHGKTQDVSIEKSSQASDAYIYSDLIHEHPELEYDLHIWSDLVHISSSQIGRFNIDNMMLAAGLAQSVWCEMPDIHSWLDSFSGLPGRQELVTIDIAGHKLTAMIDFAITPDALEILYTSTRQMWFSHLIAVFGATGDRDAGKRPEMWRVASMLCDEIIITQDENYSEDGMKIMQAIKSWIVHDSVCTYCLIQDRVEAIHIWIQRSLDIVEKNPDARPIVICTGMANFAYRQMGDEKQERSEKSVIEDGFKNIQVSNKLT